MSIEAKAVIGRLVERFVAQRESYMNSAYKEAQLRQEFIDPMWKALGWDIDNEHGYAEQYKDVIHEDAIKVSADAYTKAPDYCFRIGGVRKFFLEAKKPSVDVSNDPEPAFQLRRYAWSAKMPLSVLTDFEELVVYDTRVKPDATDKASVARVMVVPFTDYVARWEELEGIFSREAVLKGSFDKYADTNKKKRGTASVDAAFLDEIEAWRDELARNLAIRNEDLSQPELNFAVQVIIDRIVFLRICEDRGVEEYATLLGTSNGANIYPRLVELFGRADKKYNSGLFHFSQEKGRSAAPDSLTPSLEIDDAVLKRILRSLYYPESPYEFSVLPADILGQVYEQFLGKVIRLTAGHQAKVEEKPEVKKAGGVYYTPTYIVNYIVKHTIGPLLDGKTPKQISGGRQGHLRILDPACGSGTFLLQAYQFLLDWYRDAYVADDTKKNSSGRAPVLFQAAGGEWRLTTSERKRILLTHIFGVDIDYQAVEVTKLSLLLKVLEGESDQTLQRTLQLFQERALPDLDQNIKSGNSLIGSEFYEQEELIGFDEETRTRVNAFDWQIEFAAVFAGRGGGFDAVIGNPPYIRMEEFKDLKDYLASKYSSHDERSDLYAYFVERAHTLLRIGGNFGMILSNKFLRSNYGSPLRDYLLKDAKLVEVVDLAGLPVFAGATVRTILLLTTRSDRPVGTLRYAPPIPPDRFAMVQAGTAKLEGEVGERSYDIEQRGLAGGWTFSDAASEELLAKMRARSQTLVEYSGSEIMMGVKSGLTNAFIIDEATRNRLLRANARSKEIIRPFVQGREVDRYHIDWARQYLIYTPKGTDIRQYPEIEEHLRQFKEGLENRATKQEWFELQQAQVNFAPFMRAPKIIFPDIAATPRFALDEVGFFGANTTYFLASTDRYLLGLLNSRLAFFYFKKTFAGLESKGETYLRFFGQYMETFPVRGPLAAERERGSPESAIAKAVGAVLEGYLKLEKANTPSARARTTRAIQSLETQIDQLVYDLYELTPQQVSLVEAATADPTKS